MVGLAETHGEIALSETGFLSRLNPAEDTVGEHDQRDRRPGAREGLHLAGIEAEAAVTHYGDAFGGGAGEISAKDARQRVAEGAVRAVADQPGGGIGQLEIGREIGARRARIGHDDRVRWQKFGQVADRKEHTSELQSLMRISYAVFCLKKKKKKETQQ